MKKLLILLILLTGCTSRLATVRPTRHKAIGKYVKADTVTRRPRYNHWAKPYELYAPVKTHKPNLK